MEHAKSNHQVETFIRIAKRLGVHRLEVSLESILRDRTLRNFDSLRREIEPADLRPLQRQKDAQIPGTATVIENPLAAHLAQHVDHFLASVPPPRPAAITKRGQLHAPEMLDEVCRIGIVGSERVGAIPGVVPQLFGSLDGHSCESSMQSA